jgi:aryl-alcohol dehydrogenase-like predicted oxidoreductase
VAFGAWGIAGRDWGDGGDPAASCRTVERALDLGLTFIDTAPTYGDGASERVLGRVLGGRRGASRRDRVILATKCGPRDDPRASLQGSLARLETDYVDLLQLHEVPEAPGALERQLERMYALVEDGAVRAIGICNATAAELARASAQVPLASCQGQYNLLDRDAEHGVLPFAHAHDLAFLAYRPLASGLLTGKYAAPPRFDPTDHRGRIHWFRGREFERRLTVMNALRLLACERDLAIAQIALAWTLAQPGVTAVLAGARTPRQVEENAAVAQTALRPADLAAIDAIVERVYAPRRLRRGVMVGDAPDASGEIPVLVRTPGAERAFTVGVREAYVMRRLDGRTPYAEVAAEWPDAAHAPLLTAQVIQLTDQLAELGLLEDTDDA